MLLYIVVMKSNLQNDVFRFYVYVYVKSRKSFRTSEVRKNKTCSHTEHIMFLQNSCFEGGICASETPASATPASAAQMTGQIFVPNQFEQLIRSNPMITQNSTASHTKRFPIYTEYLCIRSKHVTLCCVSSCV